MNLEELTIQSASSGLRRRDFSSTELTRYYLQNIGEKNSSLNAYLDIYAEEALETAGRVDRMIKDGESLPDLAGIPLAVKDNIVCAGKKTTAGSKILGNFISPFEATVIRRLKNNGAVILGKTNLDEFAMGSSTENSAFGPTKNPHDYTRVAGGSSGGSAAAVAADMCLGALGSDTGGSIRQPSSFCGIVGFKPTYGAISRHGLIAMASSLDQIGPMAKSVEDIWMIFSSIAGKDEFDATSSRNYITPKMNPDKEFSLKNLRVGVPREYFTGGLEKGVEEIIKKSVKKLEKAGTEIKEVSLPNLKYALATYYIITPAEISANMARFDGIRYGLRNKHARSLREIYEFSRHEGLGSEVKRRILLGTYILSAGYYDAYYLKAQKMRQLIRQDFKKIFEEVDLIAGPTTPSPAFKIGEKTDDPLKMYLEDIYTVSVNLAGLPAISLPADKLEKENKKLPVGLQLIGNWFKEENLLSFGKLIEKEISL